MNQMNYGRPGVGLDVREFRHFHMCGAVGGGAEGFQRATARVGKLRAKFRCIGSVDVDAAANRDFERRIGVKATTLDLFDRAQYIAFHGKEPPSDWREATPEDIRRAAGYERPHVVFTSPPCKGFSGLLAEGKSKTDKYQALNALTIRGIWLMMEAWADDPPEIVLMENVPRIQTRGRHLLDQIRDLLTHYGYAVAETKHDCGELGGLAESRKRFLLVARHQEKVPAFLYEPPKRPLKSVGSVLARMLLPGDFRGGPMHRIPNLSWKTWLRLAFVDSGSDWRSLNKLAVEDGYLRDYRIVPEQFGTAHDVPDPHFDSSRGDYAQYGVCPWDKSMGAVINVKSPGQGTFTVQDPRIDGIKHSNSFRVVKFDRHAGTVTGGHGSGSGGQVVADPRPNLERGRGDHYLTAGHYGVTGWKDTTGAVSSAAGHDNGRWSVADPRVDEVFVNEAFVMPNPDDKLIAVIRAMDGTWHRPFTTLELAAIQSLVDPEQHLHDVDYIDWRTAKLAEMGDLSAELYKRKLLLDGTSDSAWRERIGNAVPPEAAEAIACEIGRTLLLALSGETFQLSMTPIWVQPVAVALAVDQSMNATC